MYTETIADIAEKIAMALSDGEYHTLDIQYVVKNTGDKVMGRIVIKKDQRGDSSETDI